MTTLKKKKKLQCPENCRTLEDEVFVQLVFFLESHFYSYSNFMYSVCNLKEVKLKKKKSCSVPKILCLFSQSVVCLVNDMNEKKIY